MRRRAGKYTKENLKNANRIYPMSKRRQSAPSCIIEISTDDPNIPVRIIRHPSNAAERKRHLLHKCHWGCSYCDLDMQRHLGMRSFSWWAGGIS